MRRSEVRGLEGEKGLEGVPPQRKFSEVKILDVRRVVNCFLCFRDKFSFLVPACPG